MSAWSNLSMREKAGFIKIGVDNGLTSLSDIQRAYNKFAEGGRLYKEGGSEKKYETVEATPIKNDIEYVDTNRLQLDQYGHVLNPDTNHYGEMVLPNLDVVGIGGGRAYYTNPNDRRLAEIIRDENRRKAVYRQIYGTDEGFYMSPFAISDKPLELVSPEFDLLTLGRSLYTQLPKYIGLGKNADKIFNDPDRYYRQVTSDGLKDALESGWVKQPSKEPGKISFNMPHPMFKRGSRWYHNDTGFDIIEGKNSKDLVFRYADQTSRRIRRDKAGRRIFEYQGQSEQAPSKYFKFYKSYGPEGHNAYFDVTHTFEAPPITGLDFSYEMLKDAIRKNNAKKALGGHIYDGETENSQRIETTKPSIAQRIKLGLANLDNEVLGRAVLIGQALFDPDIEGREEARALLTLSKKDVEDRGYKNKYLNGLPQSTYLLPEFERQILFENAGWTRLGNGDYNLVNQAASKYGKALPTYQTGPDAIDRSELIPFGNMLTDYDIIMGDYELPDAKYRPSTFYIGPENKIYVKEEDLNDYNNLGFLGKALDLIGHPLVVTTGIQPYIYGGKPMDLQSIYEHHSPVADLMEDYMNNQGLHGEKINGRWQFVGPDVIVTPNGYAWGGNLYGDGGGPLDILKRGFNKAISIGSNLYHNVKDVFGGEKNKSNKDPLDKTTRQYGKLKSYARQMYENEDKEKHRKPTDIEKKIFALSDSIDAATPAYYIPIHRDEMFHINKTKNGKKEYAAAKMSTNMIDSIYKYYNPIVQDLDVILGQPDKEMTWGNPSVDESRKFLTGKDVPKEKQKQFINDGTWAFSPYNLLKYNNVVMRNYMYLREKYGADSPETQNWLKDNYKWLKHRANQIEFTGENVLTKAAKLYNRDYEKESYNSGDPLYENRVIKNGKEMRTIPQVKEWETSL